MRCTARLRCHLLLSFRFDDNGQVKNGHDDDTKTSHARTDTKKRLLQPLRLQPHLLSFEYFSMRRSVGKQTTPEVGSFTVVISLLLSTCHSYFALKPRLLVLESTITFTTSTPTEGTNSKGTQKERILLNQQPNNAESNSNHRHDNTNSTTKQLRP